MKKITSLILITILAFSLLAGCSNNEAVDETLPDIRGYHSTPESFSEEEQEIREIYLKLFEEKSKEANFITEEEIALYEELGFYIRNEKEGWISSYDERYHETSDFYSPIVITTEETTGEKNSSIEIIGETSEVEERKIMFIDEYGNLCMYDLSSKREETLSYNIHLLANMNYIDSQDVYSVAIDGDKVQLWEMGVKKAEAKLPANAYYVGYGYWEGYLFRSGDKVYSVQLKEKEKESEDSEPIPEIVVERIAKGVKYVIAADYKLNSDAWEQPLFFMKDGSVKAYCNWAGENDSPRDHKSHLVSIQYEGGYQ